MLLDLMENSRAVVMGSWDECVWTLTCYQIVYRADCLVILHPQQECYFAPLLAFVIVIVQNFEHISNGILLL